MKNINLQKQNSLNYSHVVVNKHVESVSGYNKLLQNRLDMFSDIVKETVPKLIGFLVNYLRVHGDTDSYDYNYVESILSDVVYEYKSIQKQGTPVLNNMSNQLKGKKVDEKTFDLLFKIITHQEEITKEILKKEITIDRIETVFNHLRDVPYYLRTDLEIEGLPDLKSFHRTVISHSNIRSMRVIISDYNPHHKQSA